ncbi:hypothetical protein VIGAN_04066500 [Vigna angularis var. angularis]|uniref:Uncharacterized protein n=1 Tax=Vigna angularis var. angularis TaxID=157739 RepID=A0A0S3RSD9_PHAAN|nr:hypothetical protein VIGAN_04066500 [Vigna angularis var. angularis]
MHQCRLKLMFESKENIELACEWFAACLIVILLPDCIKLLLRSACLKLLMLCNTWTVISTLKLFVAALNLPRNIS